MLNNQDKPMIAFVFFSNTALLQHSGLDRVTHAMIKEFLCSSMHSPSYLQSFLVFEFLSFHLKVFFYDPHPQDGKPLYSFVSFWHFFLTSCISKLFECIILFHLVLFKESNFNLSPCQAVSAMVGLLMITFFYLFHFIFIYQT